MTQLFNPHLFPAVHSFKLPKLPEVLSFSDKFCLHINSTPTCLQHGGKLTAGKEHGKYLRSTPVYNIA